MGARNKVICLMGPTASGKTDLAVRLVQQYPVDIISVDSAMVYHGMDIGSAKPSAEELAVAPHHLINICDPAENYSAGQFCQDALELIDKIHQAGRTPLLVGGTMMYFNLLQRGFNEFPQSDKLVRDKVSAEAKNLGWQKLHQRLAEIDPQTASKIHPNDQQRIQRALEVFYSTGNTMTELQQKQQWQKFPFDFTNIIIAPKDRATIHARIEQRLDKMLAQGLVAEVEALFNRGDLNADMTSIRMVGYRQVWAYLVGEYDLTEMRLRAIYATRQFAKRQYTWLRQWESASRFDSDAADLFSSLSCSLDFE